MPKQTELEKKIEELSYLRGAKAMIQRRFRVSLPVIYWADLTQLEATMARERLHDAGAGSFGHRHDRSSDTHGSKMGDHNMMLSIGGWVVALAAIYVTARFVAHVWRG